MKNLPIAVLATLGITHMPGCDDTITGPCLSIIEDTDTGTETETETETARVEPQGSVRDRVLARDVLPADVANRLRKTT